MLFNSIEYFLFIHVFVILYWCLRKHLSFQNVFLLAGSYFFYGLWDYRFLGLIIISSIVDYVIGLRLHKTTGEKTRKVLLAISVIVNLGILFVFKYFNFFVESFSLLLAQFGFSPNESSLQLILPVGISFYTFQTLSYTIDIYRRKLEPTRDIIGFFTFVAFFPQLVAGPIERASNLLPQILEKRQLDKDQFVDGLRQILWGLFKKVVIADNCAFFVDLIFEGYDTMDGWVLWVGAVLFAFQIYCDFSGYSDIAIGSAKLLGIKLMQNFSTPYFSRNIGEFWRRWHISLSTWFRDYLYIPLGGSRASRPRQLFNVMTTFVISGLWHGANWTFVFWGFLHGCFYIPSIFMNTNRKYLQLNMNDSIRRTVEDTFKILITFSLVCIAWVFFRAETISVAFGYLTGMLGITFDPEVADISIISKHTHILYSLLGGILFLLIVEWINRKLDHGLKRISRFVLIRFMLYLILAYAIADGMIGESPFIYFQF